MTTREIEARVRDLAWPSPPADLRERAVTAAVLRLAEAPAMRPSRPVPMGEPRAARRPIWATAPVLLALAGLLVIGIAACAGLDVWAQRDLDAELTRLETKYGSLDPATMAPSPVPDADNRASVVRAAAGLVVPIPDHGYVPFPVPSPVPAELRAFADANREAVRVLGEIRTRHQSNWNLDDRKDSPPWESVQMLSRAVYVTALLDLEAGRPDDAADVIVSGLGVSASLRQEPNALAQVIRIGPWSMQASAIRRLVSESTPSAPALRDLASWLAENRTPAPMTQALLSHMTWVNAIFARMEKGDIDAGVVEHIYPMTWPDWPSVFVRPAAIVGRPFVRMARVRSLRLMDQVLDALTGPRPRPIVEAPPQPQRWELVDRLVDKFTSGIWREADSGDDFAGQLAVAELGVALRRFKLGHVDYPGDLSALVPDYLDRLPIDPYTGRPPDYSRQGSGFTLQARERQPGLRAYLSLEWDVKR